MAPSRGLTDHPVERAEQDVLDRARYAELLATEIRRLDAGHGAVVGLLGPWGHGETSLMNMVVERLADDPTIPIVEFNPWLFSGTEQLIATFFEEISVQQVRGPCPVTERGLFCLSPRVCRAFVTVIRAKVQVSAEIVGLSTRRTRVAVVRPSSVRALSVTRLSRNADYVCGSVSRDAMATA